VDAKTCGTIERATIKENDESGAKFSQYVQQGRALSKVHCYVIPEITAGQSIAINSRQK